MAKRRYTIYRIKEERSSLDEVVRDDYIETMRVGKIGEYKATLFVRPMAQTKPKWLDILSDCFDVSDLPIYNSQSSALLIVHMDNRMFALTFGNGRHMLKEGVCEERFGLLAALNMIDSDSVRSIDRKSFESLGNKANEQTVKPASVASFGLDPFKDMLLGVMGIPKSEKNSSVDHDGTPIYGKMALSANLDCTLNQLPEYLSYYSDKSDLKDYLKDYPWVDNIVETKDPSVVADLDSMLVEKLIRSDFDDVWFAPPDRINWSRVAGFYVGGRSSHRKKVPDLEMDLSIDSLMRTFRMGADLELKHVKSKKVQCYYADSDKVEYEWSAYNCIFCEIIYGNEVYMLNGGNWYRIDKDYKNEIASYMSRIASSSLSYPPYDGCDEGEYNKRTCEQWIRDDLVSACLMDGKNISYGGGHSRVEACDIIREKTFVYAKRYSGSSTLSHLFAQGYVAGISLIRDRELRAKVNERISDPILQVNESKFEAADYEIVYLIIDRDGGDRKTALPFFSQVTLKMAHQSLESVGYSVSLDFVPKGQNVGS